MKLPSRLALAFFGSGLLTIVVGAFLSSFPAPFSRLDISLVLACGLVAIFRPTEALAAALGAGLFMDALSASVPGVNLLAGPIAIFLADLIFRRFLANLSWPSFAVLNILTFIFKGLLLGAVSAVTMRLSGLISPVTFIEWGTSLLLASLAQTILGLIMLGLSRWIFSWFRSHYLYSQHAR